MNLMRRLVLGDLDLTAYPFSVEFDEDHGAPENVYDTLVSLLADGEVSVSNRVTNREITITVLVEGPTLADLARNEATLVAECDKPRSTLSVDPGDTYAPASVFDVFRVQARLLYGVDLEQSNFRRYELTIPAGPYVRAADVVVTPAQATTPTYTSVDTGSSLTGWAAVSSRHALSIVSGKVTATGIVGTSGVAYFERTASVTVGSGKYLAVDATWTVPLSRVELVLTTDLGSGYVSQLVTTVDLGGGVSRLFFGLPAGAANVSVIRFQVFGSWNVGLTFAVDQIQTADAIPFFGTARQKGLSLIPGGSVKTQGSIQVAHASASLGKTIVYTHPSGTGYLPPLTPWRVSGAGRSTDSTLLSGGREVISTTATNYNVPVSALPRGRVEVWAWLRSNAATPFGLYWAVDSWINSTIVGTSQVTRAELTLVANTWTLVCLGAATMPPYDIGPSGYVRVSLVRDAADSETIDLDEAYLFATDEGRLSIIDCGTGTAAAGGPSNRLWIDAPSQENDGLGGIYRGNAEDRSDAWHAGAFALPWQVHNFDPAGTNVFVATQGTIDAATSLEHYRRYHTHVALED